MTSEYEKELEKYFSEAINLEHAAFYFYLSVGAHFDSQTMSLLNLRDFFYDESKDELTHARRVIKHMNERNLKWTRMPIETPDPSAMTVVQVFEKAEEFEQKVLDNYLRIQRIAGKVEDYSTNQFLDDFVALQLKEVKAFHDKAMNARRCTDQLGIFIFDQSFAKKK